MGQIATYAGIVFEVTENKTLSFQDMSITRGVNYEEHPRAKDQPYMEYVSNQNAEMRLTVIAKASLGVNPRTLWSKFAKIRDEHKAAYFFLGVTRNAKQYKTSKKLGHAGQRRIGSHRWVITDIDNNFKAFNVKGTPIDIAFNITLKEYPHSKAQKDKPSTSKPNGKKTQTTANKKNYTLYTVKSGDTLWTLAKKYYGKGSKYTKIYNANRDGKDGTHKLTDPNKLQVGWKIKIPK